MTKILFLFFCFIFFVSYSQKFTVLSSDEVDYKIDWGKDLKITDTNKVFLLGFIIEPPLFNDNFMKTQKIDESWLNSYEENKIDLKIYVAHPDKAAKEFKIDKKNVKESTLYIHVNNKQISSFLKKNADNLSLNICDHCSLDKGKKQDINEVIFQLINIDSYKDFQWKTNQLLYNLDHIPEADKKEKPTPKTNFFQISYQSSLINSKNTQFDRASNNQIDLIMKKKICSNKDSIQILFGGGFSLAQNNFSSSNNFQCGQKGSYPLDSIYASLSGVRENHLYQSINFVLSFAVKIKKFEFSLSPFYALQSNLSSTVTGGSITTYGFKNQITDYLYDIPELGLKTQTEEILKVQNYFKTRSYGFNVGVSYNINLGTLIVAPNLNLKFIYIQNKNSISNAYSIPEDKYNGLFATLKNKYFFIPTLGLSISF